MKNGDIAMGLETANERKGGFLGLDYDTKELFFVVNDIRDIQKKFFLGNCILISTQHGYHAIFFWDNNLSWREIRRIINFSKADAQFKEFKDKFKFLRFRIQGKDLEILKVVESVYHKNNELGDFYFEMYKNLKF